ncbi:hypothetical protein N7462_000596 [Penicillium macrosclerotiorum]|uniref:uncharacterized protein n=1 Tax=Penicillium macrosclerotiorum TaxID=303699 RepID=UPI0025480AF7|nr:uncharacterized protein N7462_000596 [Penicillium macrosclerotiorum]KAJ5698591.1 hypothetical protein N7462_000596 [Penicillium macrosclerotiorum]
MGRKPNQLILEFFIRGPKLEDSSNRYQHTCKACGEKFPKGRIDSLTNHLVKKCQAIPLRDRQRVLLRLHELPDLTEGDASKDPSAAGAKGKAGDGSFPNRPNFDGLNVLAEASRQVGASDTTKRGPAYTQSVTAGGKTVVVDPALEAEFTVQGSQHGDEKQEDGANAQGTPQASSTPTIPALPSHTSDHHTSMSPPLGDGSLTPEPTSNARQSQLSMIAASANEMVPQGLTMDGELGADGLKMSQWNQQLSTHEQLLFDSLQEHDPSLTAATQRAASFPRPIAMNPNTQAKGFVNEFGNSTKPAKPKVRGRFTPERRREVQEVRKRGACIRCRMLKKPCSGDTPCTTCASVESARLWKHPCIRTRLSEEFELYNANLHATLAYHDTNAIRNQIKFEHYAGRIEVTHMEESMVYVTISGLQGHRASVSALDPQLQGLGDDQFSGPPQEIYLLDSDADDIPTKLELYIKKTGAFFIERETSPFMKPTLQLASELSQTKKDTLLERAVDLWVATHILVDTELNWKTFCNPTLPPTSMHSLSQPSDEGRLPIDEVTDHESYNLLGSQLRAAMEKRAMQLSKSVINDLERRLLQRQKTGWFETFLVAIVLLNCVERTCWLFRSWDNESFAQRWPLDKRPPYYFNQSERFADILHMLLRMRSLPPKTTIRPDNGTLKAVDGSDENAMRWFDMIQVSPFYLEERANALFDPTDSRSLDLCHSARLLQPSAA